MQLFFFKVHPACYKIVNSIKPGSDSKRLISMLWIVQKLYVGRKVIYVRCINCSYNNVAKDIHLLDKKYFLSIQETCTFHASKSF